MKKMRIILALMLAALVLCTAAMAEEIDRAAAYEEAMALYKAKDYEQAQLAFEALGNYKESRSYANKSKWYFKEQQYRDAVRLYKDGSYEEAKAIFESLGSFEESRNYVRKCETGIQRQQYNQAKDLYNAGSYEQARDIFAALDRFENSRTYLEEIEAILAQQQLDAYEQQCFADGVAAMEAGELEEARDLFIQAGDAEGAMDNLYQVLEVLALRDVYQRAEAELAKGHCKEAYVRYKALGDYENSAARMDEAWQGYLLSVYEEAVAAEETDGNRAYLLHLSLGDYADSAERAGALAPSIRTAGLYKAAQQLRKDDRPAAAAIGYELCQTYEDSEEYAAQMKKDAESYWQFEHAHILTQLWQLEEANAIYADLGNYKYASRMGMERLTPIELRDDATTPMSETFTAPDGTTHRYRMFKGVARWVEAKAFCEALGGHLATMTTPEENEFVHDFMWNSGFTTAYFGLVDEDRDR
ncbi:MAG: C-type lectin domain-containing protein, partial [Clostridia bacterium]|nr:C-type lectin domain-containing protein [Clostridia bacterium]